MERESVILDPVDDLDELFDKEGDEELANQEELRGPEGLIVTITTSLSSVTRSPQALIPHPSNIPLPFTSQSQLHIST